MIISRPCRILIDVCKWRVITLYTLDKRDASFFAKNVFSGFSAQTRKVLNDSKLAVSMICRGTIRRTRRLLIGSRSRRIHFSWHYFLLSACSKSAHMASCSIPMRPPSFSFFFFLKRIRTIRLRVGNGDTGMRLISAFRQVLTTFE